MSEEGTSAITLQRLKELLDSYGANPARWPKAERDPALALLEASPELAPARRQAAELDALLDRATLPRASGTLTAAMLASAGRPAWRQWTWLIWPFGPIWKPALGLASAAVVGAVLGYVTATPAEIVEISFEIQGLILG